MLRYEAKSNILSESSGLCAEERFNESVLDGQMIVKGKSKTQVLGAEKTKEKITCVVLIHLSKASESSGRCWPQMSANRPPSSAPP